MLNKLSRRDKEIDRLRRELRTKLDEIQTLELQVDTIPILKTKIGELERTIQFNERVKKGGLSHQQSLQHQIVSHAQLVSILKN